MSSIASLYNVPGTPEEMGIWSFAHAAHHRDINRVIFQKLNVQLPEFVLDPLDLDNVQNWIYLHQLMHNNQDALLGISGYDLTDVSFDDENQFAGWIWLNASEHYQAANTLEIG